MPVTICQTNIEMVDWKLEDRCVPDYDATRCNPQFYISVFLSGSISESVLEIRNPLTLEARSVEFLIREPEFGILIRYR